MNVRQLDELMEAFQFVLAGQASRLNAAEVRRVFKIEDELSCRLFVRDGNRICALTGAGRQFFRDGKRLRERIIQAASEAQNIAAGRSGRIRLGVCEEIITGQLRQLLISLSTQWPKVEIDLVERSSSAIATAVRRREIDLGCVVTPTNCEGLIEEELLTEHWMAICPPGHPLADRQWVYPSDLVGIPLVLAGEQFLGDGHRAIAQAFERAALPMTVGAQMLNRSTMLTVVAAGAGITFVPSSFRAVVNGRPVAGPLLADTPLTIAGIYNAMDPSGLAMRLLGLFRQVLSESGAA